MPGLDPGIQRSFDLDAMGHWVYILANKRNGTLYVGVTRDLSKRMNEHRMGIRSSFSTKYGVKRLVFAERHESAVSAIQREKNIKHWSRKWKLELIEKGNPEWADLYGELI
jgi:putative endonuclease